MTSETDLRQALETAFLHCRPGGAALFVPDCVRETFEPATEHGGHDREARGLRYLEWRWDPDPDDSTYRVDFADLLREADRDVRCVYDRHTFGLFSRSDWLRWIAAAGFEARLLTIHHSEVGDWELFLGIKPG